MFELDTALLAFGGDYPNLAKGIDEILRVKGVKKGDDVLFVGHSLGGIVAARVADKWAKAGRLRSAQVLAMGAPIPDVEFHKNVQILSVAIDKDMVPMTPGKRAPDAKNVRLAVVPASMLSSGRGSRSDLGSHHSDDLYFGVADTILKERFGSAADWATEADTLFSSAVSFETTTYSITRTSYDPALPATYPVLDYVANPDPKAEYPLHVVESRQPAPAPSSRSLP